MGRLILILLISMSALPPHARAQDTSMRVYIPRIAFDAVVGECPIVDGWHQIGPGVCHLEDTQEIRHTSGNIVLAGHTPGVFADLVYVEVGDQVMVWNDHAVEVYRVTVVELANIDDMQWLMPTDDETLTLITCAGNLRRVIHAERIG